MSAFSEKAPEFERFLESIKDHPNLRPGFGGSSGNIRFIPRNFLVEERLDSSRVDNYTAFLPSTGPVDFEDWNQRHNEYLNRRVYVVPPAIHDYFSVEKSDPETCPETFRAPRALLSVGGVDFDTRLVRMVSVDDIARMSRESKAHVLSVGAQAVRDTHPDSPARLELSRIFEEAYTGDRCQRRPTFAAFYEDFSDELSDPDSTEWANRLRDRLGLYNLSQFYPGGLPRDVFLFWYKIRELPRYRREADRRPMSVPVVIDHALFEAFCPAPEELERGRLVNLGGLTEEPAREVLHLFMPLKGEHLFRVGTVTRPVPEDLAPARRDHLLLLRMLAKREDYAHHTDADILNE